MADFVVGNNAPAFGQPMAGTDGSLLRLLGLAQFHNSDHQTLSGAIYGVNTGGVAQLLNADGSIDRQREAGQDAIASAGIATGVTNLKQRFSTTSVSNVTAGSNIVVVVATSAGFKVGGTAILDVGQAGQEPAIIKTVVGNTVTLWTTVNPHNGSVTPFVVTTSLYNEEVDASGELDLASGGGAATAVEYIFDGVTYQRARSVHGSGLHVNTCTGNVTAASGVVLTLVSALPASLQVGAPVLIDALNASLAEFCQILAVNIGTKQITVNLTKAHNGSVTPFQLSMPFQSLTAPTLVGGFGIPMEATAVFSGTSATTGATLYSVEKDLNAVFQASGNYNPVLNSASTAGMDADMEFGGVFTAAQTFADSTGCLRQNGQGGESLASGGGRRCSVLAAGANTLLVKSGGGRLVQVLITVAGTASLTIFDNTSASGNIIGITPVTTTVGQIFTFSNPALVGIFASNPAGGPGVTISYF